MRRNACAGWFLGGVLLLVIGALVTYGHTAILDEHAFGARAQAAFEQDEVRDEVAGRIADRAVLAEPRLAPLRPTLDAAVSEVLQSYTFPARFRAGAEAMQRHLFEGDEVELRLPNTSSELRAAVGPESSAFALLPPRDPQLFHIGDGGGRLETQLVAAAPLARRFEWVGPVAIVLGLLALVASARRASTRRRGARRAALGFAAAGGVVVTLTTVGRAVVLAGFDTSHGDVVVGTIWDAFLGDLRLWGLVVGAGGLILAAACEPGTRGATRRLAARVLSPCGSAGRLARAAALLILAVLLVWMPEVPVDLAIITLAGAFLFTAAAEVVRVSSTR